MYCSVASILAFIVQQLDITLLVREIASGERCRRQDSQSHCSHHLKDRELLQLRYGLTNIVDRATARADELDPEELVAGQRQLAAKVQHYQPRFLAVLGIGLSKSIQSTQSSHGTK
jgi:hypothetical protein